MKTASSLQTLPSSLPSDFNSHSGFTTDRTTEPSNGQSIDSDDEEEQRIYGLSLLSLFVANKIERDYDDDERSMNDNDRMSSDDEEFSPQNDFTLAQNSQRTKKSSHSRSNSTSGKKNHHRTQSSCSSSKSNISTTNSNINTITYQDDSQFCPSSSSSAHLPSHGTSWTEEEQKKFEQGLQIYGRGKWVPIAKFVKTRNALQVKNHARNYFRKAEEDGIILPTAEKPEKKSVKLESFISSCDEDADEAIAAASMMMMATSEDSSDGDEEETKEDCEQSESVRHQSKRHSSKESTPNQSSPSSPTSDSEIPLKRGSLPLVMKEREKMLNSLPVPTEELYIDEEGEISEQEKIFNKEFFMQNSSKTPERYVRIRNFCLSTWRNQCPQFVSKTAVRVGLKDCGDVNAIGRVHEYLDRIGAINFGSSPNKRRKKGSAKTTTIINNEAAPCAASSAPTTSDNVAPQIEAKLSTKSKPIETSVSPVKKAVKRKRELSALEDYQTGSYSPIYFRYSDRPKRKCAKTTGSASESGVESKNEPYHMISCRDFKSGQENVPFKVKVEYSSLIFIDIHAHIASTEIIGLLGGVYDVSSNTLFIKAAVRCESTTKNATFGHQCEMDTLSEAQAREILSERNLNVVGWYHSHPTHIPNPSLRDLENQANYQSLFSAEGEEPFIGIIVSPYNPANTSARSQFNFLHICRNSVSDKVHSHQYTPFTMPYETVCESDLDIIADIKKLLERYREFTYRVNLSEEYKPSQTTKLDKLLQSIKLNSPTDFVFDKQTFSSLRNLLID